MSTDAATSPVRAYSIGGLQVQVRGPKLCRELDCMPGMGEFAADAHRGPDIVVEEAEASGTDGGREVFAFDLNEGREQCRMTVAADGAVGYRFDSGSRLACGRGDGEPLGLCWHGDRAELRYLLWLAYAHGALGRGAVPVHASTVVWRDRAVLCLGESGTGKSTHTRLWRENIEGSWLLNDDSPIVRVERDGVWAYGSPWSGKTPCFRPVRVPVAALLRLRQAPCNRIGRLATLPAFAALQPSCPPTLMHDERCTDRLVDFVGHVIERVPVYMLDCLPDADAARLSHQTLFPQP